MTGIRLDQLLVDRGLAESRTQAQAVIMAGLVYSGEQRMNKSGHSVSRDFPVELRGSCHQWVSRGGLKLVKALDHFGIDPADMIALDIGASTGGFTDVLLHHGARKVYAIDVGHGQFAWKLRQDDRVVLMERTNARYLTREDITDSIDIIVCDASFIGLEMVLPAALDLTAENACLIALIKPQFEVGKGRVGKGGVVREPELHEEVCSRIESWLKRQAGWSSMGICQSPIHGADGNIEFLICGKKIATTTPL